MTAMANTQILQVHALFRAKGNNAKHTLRVPSLEQTLLTTSNNACANRNINFKCLTPIQRLFITHFRCHECGLLPLYYIDISHVKRVRCMRCAHLISFTSSGKYGKLRKEIAFTLLRQLKDDNPVECAN